MAGKKGMTWADEKKRSVKFKKTIRLDGYELAQAEALAEERQWSLSKVLYLIIVGKLPQLEQEKESKN